ncbi:hypothetical protein JW964_13225 [candidate division KSB1 bacterium]|nr:hypothetical protein [candidate division KSB1 bacterium]
MQIILEILALISIIIGTSALYLFLYNDLRPAGPAKKYSEDQQRRNYLKLIYYIISLIVSELLGIFFLMLNGSVKSPILTYNGLAFLVASCICSVITILKAIRYEQVNLFQRIVIQLTILAFAMFFIRISIVIPTGAALEQVAGKIVASLQFFAVIYFIIGVIALLLILWDAIQPEIEYFKYYLFWVMLIGISVGTSLYIVSYNWRALLI